MLTVTNAAKEQLSKLLDDSNATDESTIRFVRGDKGLDVKLDKPADSDEKFEYNGRTILVMDGKLADALSDKKLESSEAEQGLGLKIVDTA